jgi:hypothetical protein
VRARPDDLPPIETRAPLARVIRWLVDKVIDTAARRTYGTLVMKFAAGKPVQVSWEEKWKIDELPAANEAALREALTHEQIRRLEEGADS